MHHQIDALAHANRLRYLPPRQKLTFAIILFILGYSGTFLVRFLITIWLTIWIVIYGGIPLRIYLKLFLIPLGFWLMSVPALMINVTSSLHGNTSPSQVVLGITLGNLYFYVSAEGIKLGLEVLSRIIALTSCLYFLLLTTTITEIIRILKQSGFPILIADLILLMYRFIFILDATTEELLTAQKSRLGYRNWRFSIKSLGILLGQLFVKTLDNYRQISLGLTSRGFNGQLKLWYSSSRYQSNLRYTVEAFSGCLLLIIYTGWYYVNGI